MEDQGVDLDERQRLFVRNAETLSRSLLLAGHELLVFINNNRALIQELTKSKLSSEVMDFRMAIPKGIRYPEAHRKWELFRYLGRSSEDYWVLLDSDMVLQNVLPETFHAIVAGGEPLVINVTFDTLPAHDRQTVVQGLRLLEPNLKAGEWFGGEFIGGTPRFFADLSSEILKRIPRYWEHWSALFHQGDEILTNVALDALAHRWPLRDAGNLGFVVRYFSATPKHLQRPLEAYREVPFWHLPSDKRWLAQLQFGSIQEIYPLYQKEFRRVRAPHPIEDLINGLKRLWGGLKRSLGMVPQ